MKRVFLGGSRRVSRLNESIRRRLEELVRRQMEIVIGDANGADRALQRQLADWAYPNVTVYFVGSRPRNNEGGWPTRHVPTSPEQRGFEFYAAKDREMARDAECGLMLWDGESRGTLSNVENLVAEHKPVALYVSPRRRFVSIRSEADLRAILSDSSQSAAGDGGTTNPNTRADLGVEAVPGSIRTTRRRNTA